MKKLFIIVFSMTIIMVFATGALATFVQGPVDPACFFVVNNDDDNSVTLGIGEYGTGTGTLHYSTDNNLYALAGSSVIIDDLEIYGGEQLVYWRLYTDTNTFISGAGLTFIGEEPGYQTVMMVWSDDPIQITVVAPLDCDVLKPVPIGSSALLLGSSIFGLLGFGLWRKHKILGSE